MKNITVTQYGIVHAIADCAECDYRDEDYRNMNKLRYRVRQHVIATGHSVTIETGVATKYSLDEGG